MKRDCEILRALASSLCAAGVEWAVVSSGSRSMPIVSALESCGGLTLLPVVDERVAGFMALGMAERSGRPVALVCTSGSAMLNYAPAVAEAYYRHLPLVVISADRPAAWINRNDGQTIRQCGALANIVKSWAAVSDDDCVDKVREVYSGLFSTAMALRCGPVHLNIHLSEPLVQCVDKGLMTLEPSINRKSVEPSELPDFPLRKVLMYIGPKSPSAAIDAALQRIIDTGKAVVLADQASNVTARGAIQNIDATLALLSAAKVEYAPELLVTYGGTPLSRRMKEWLRSIPGLRHVELVEDGRREDTYGRSVAVVSGDQAKALTMIASKISADESDKMFTEVWRDASTRALALTREYLKSVAWSDLGATYRIMSALDGGEWELQVSNGMTLRNANACHFAVPALRVGANRGVNGIDGSTSTAIGAAIVATPPTVLLTGDMSALYDVAALFAGHTPNTFRMVVFDNGGGEIFRFIGATKDAAVTPKYVAAMPATDWCAVASAAGLDFYEADSYDALDMVLHRFLSQDTNRPAMLAIKTSSGNSAYFDAMFYYIKQTINQ